MPSLFRSFCLAFCLFALLLGAVPVQAADVAVVDTARVMSESTPGKAALEHLQKVKGVLDKALNDLAARYKGKEGSPEARQDIAQSRAVLQQELNAHEQLVAAELNRCLTESVVRWRAKNKKYDLVLPKSGVLDSDSGMDVTRAVLTEMNSMKPTFPPMPEVSLKDEAAAPAPKEKQGRSSEKKR